MLLTSDIAESGWIGSWQLGKPATFEPDLNRKEIEPLPVSWYRSINIKNATSNLKNNKKIEHNWLN